MKWFLIIYCSRAFRRFSGIINILLCSIVGKFLVWSLINWTGTRWTYEVCVFI